MLFVLNSALTVADCCVATTEKIKGGPADAFEKTDFRETKCNSTTNDQNPPTSSSHSFDRRSCTQYIRTPHDEWERTGRQTTSQRNIECERNLGPGQRK